MSFKSNELNTGSFSSPIPLEVDEVVGCLRRRWGVTYDLKLLIKKDKIYLQMMWGFLEQQSFPIGRGDLQRKFKSNPRNY